MRRLFVLFMVGVAVGVGVALNRPRPVPPGVAKADPRPGAA
jgi:hypothetical protein